MMRLNLKLTSVMSVIICLHVLFIILHYFGIDLGTPHGIPQSRLHKLDPEQFLRCLAQCQLLSTNNMEFLHQLMIESKHDDLAETISEYVKKHANDKLSQHKPNGTIGKKRIDNR